MENQKHVLLVEDDANDMEFTIHALGECGITKEKITTVRDGVEALDYLYGRGKFVQQTTRSLSVVLLDIKMPRMNGVEVLKQIKSDEQLRVIPVVMLTSSREEKDIAECYRLGANAFLVKPIQFKDYIEAVKKTGKFWMYTNEPPRGSLSRS